MTVSGKPEDSSRQASALMVRLIEASWLSRAIHVFVSLDIPDLLSDGPKGSEELAQATGTRTQPLYRVLRALAAEGILAGDEQQRFSLTPLGATLRRNQAGSLHDWALLMLGKVHQDAWSDVMHSIRTGESAFEHRYRMDLWQYRAAQPEYANLFDAAMAGFTRTYIENLLKSYSFSELKRIVDVGGGNGSLLIGILQANPEAQGVVYDLPDVAQRAKQRIEEAGLQSRCVFTCGDALAEVPVGGDAYILSRVLHDWDDERACRILGNCRTVLTPHRRVLVIERAVPESLPGATSVRDDLLSDIHMTDLNMLVMTTGRERTLLEYERLFQKAGLALARLVRTETAINVMELQADSMAQTGSNETQPQTDETCGANSTPRVAGWPLSRRTPFIE